MKTVPIKGVTGLIVVIAMLAFFLIEVPATRWFLLGSVVLGGTIGGLLYWWNNRER